MSEAGTVSGAGRGAPGTASRRRALVIGAAAGVVLVGSTVGYWAYDLLATPATPNVEQASIGDIVAYFMNSRGMLRLARIDQDRFMAAWRARFSRDAEHRALKAYLDTATASQREVIQDALFTVGKRKFLDDAREYERLKGDNDRAYPFLRDRLIESGQELAWLKGNGDPAKDLTGALGSGMPRNPDEWLKLVVGRTTPEERLVGEQYLTALKNVREQERKFRHSSAPPPSSTPAGTAPRGGSAPG
ncbi:MAG: hypothetical protein U1A27_13160 [Phycisphaerae bacterium]